MLNFKIIGYTNPLEVGATPLVTIANMNQLYYAIFPDSTSKQLNIKDADGLSKIKSLILEPEEKYISKGQYSYLTITEKIVTGYSYEIVENINEDLKVLKHTDFEHYELLKEIMISEINEKKKLDTGNQNVILITATRVKSNKEFAKRIILQHFKNGGYKTTYKKNLFTNDPIEDQDKTRFETALNKSLEFLSEKFKDGSIKYLYLDNVA